MKFDSVSSLRNLGFSGFRTVAELRMERLASIPRSPGVYVIAYPDAVAPIFLDCSPAGHFKGRDPTIPVAHLQDAWVDGAVVLYIGKAGGGGAATTLRRRVSTYLSHGRGVRAAHSGGRLIWQIASAGNLLVGWREIHSGEPRAVEKSMIANFVAHYGKRPFANRTG